MDTMPDTCTAYCTETTHTLACENARRLRAGGKWKPLSPSTVDVGTITEYGLTQKLSNPIRCF